MDTRFGNRSDASDYTRARRQANRMRREAYLKVPLFAINDATFTFATMTELAQGIPAWYYTALALAATDRKDN